MDRLTGSCLCGEVSYEIENNFAHFQLCHCEQCQKTTGTAHASNLFTDPACIEWTSGQGSVVRYDVEDRSISNAFCKLCGSRVPYLSKSSEVLCVPAGSLDGKPGITPKANIFWPERAAWYDEALGAQRYDTFVK